MKYTYVLLVLVISCSLLFAASASPKLTSKEFVKYLSMPNGCESMIAKYGNKINIPSTAATYFIGEKANLIFYNSSSGAMIKASGKVGSNAIENIKCYEVSDADYTVKISYDAAIALSKSKKPVSTFKQYKNKGKISITTKSFFQAMKIKIAETLIN